MELDFEMVVFIMGWS